MHSVLVVGLLAAPVFVLGANLLGHEVSSGALNLVLLRPISRRSYVISRVAGTWAAIVLLFLVIGALTSLTHGTITAAIFIHLANYATAALFVLSMFALFGSFTNGYFSAGLYFLWAIFVVEGLGAIVVALGAMGVNVPDDLLDVPACAALVRATFASAPDELSAAGLAFIWIWSLAALALACFFFERRDLPAPAE
jgi:ABC-type transport system involved in multi-copper enzyme maturation permease subunit